MNIAFYQKGKPQRQRKNPAWVLSLVQQAGSTPCLPFAQQQGAGERKVPDGITKENLFSASVAPWESRGYDVSCSASSAVHEGALWTVMHGQDLRGAYRSRILTVTGIGGEGVARAASQKEQADQ